MKSIKFVQNGKGELEPQSLKTGTTLLNDKGDIAADSLGYQVAIDTMTYIRKQVISQKFYEVPIADHIPLTVGEGAFYNKLLTNMDYSVGGDFESGLIRQGLGNDRLAQADAAVSTKTVEVANWAKGINYSIFEINEALVANNWDAVAAKERARKKNWDLGLQQVAFMGSKTDAVKFPGLLTSTAINANVDLIQQPISTMSAADLNTFVTGLIAAYFANSKSTALPDRFVMPYSDFFGLQSLTPGTVGTFPISRIEYLTNAFKAASRNPNFRIEPLSYCDSDTNTAFGVGKQLYLLYRFDNEVVRMDIPVDYTVTQSGTVNNFQFQSAAYGAFTGAHFYRALEALQFEYTPAS